MAEFHRGRWIEVCELCEGEFGETTGEVEGELACAECVFEDRMSERRS